jgi:hypothetical protein
VLVLQGQVMTQYFIDSNYGQMPNQIHGHTDDGRVFYFRGRHGSWGLSFAESPDILIGSYDYQGDALHAGWYEPEEWEQCFWDVIENCVEKGRPHPTFAAQDINKYQLALKTLHDEILARSPEYSIPVQDVVKRIRELDPDRMF